MGRRFEGKIAFITGASSGIGAALALELARQGAHVALAARRADRLEEVRLQIEALGQRSIALVCDVTSLTRVTAAVDQVVETFGGIDIAVANAGFGVSGLLEKLDTDLYRRQFQTNFFGVLNTVYAVLPHLTESRGRLGLVSSVMGRIGMPVLSAYCASKFAVHGLAESLYYELAQKGVSVTSIQPGFVESEIRSVDNRGVFHPGHRDPIPRLALVPARTAAREIARKLYWRRFDAVITGHGKALVYCQRLFPGLLRAVVRWSMRGRLNPRALLRRARGKRPA